MKKFLITSVACMLALFLCACSAPTATVTPSGSSEPQPSTSAGVQEMRELGSYVQKPSVRDYTYSWWPDAPIMDEDHSFCVQTGYYGISFSAVNGMPQSLGYISKEYTQTQALVQDKSVINALVQISSVAATVKTDALYTFSGKVNYAAYSTSPIRIIESGQYMQSFEVGALAYNDANGNEKEDLYGRLEIKATPRYFSLNYQMFFKEKISDVDLSFALGFANAKASVNDANNTAIVTLENGTGFVAYMPNGRLTFDNGVLTFIKEGISFEKKNTTDGLSVIIIPSESPSEADLAYYNAVAGVTVKGTTVTPKEGRGATVDFDASRGVWVFNTNGMCTTVGSGFADSDKQNIADRIKFDITNESDVTVKVPVSFNKDRGACVDGFGPMLRDAVTGEPMGLQMQISKNWHPYTGDHRNQWYYGLDGSWYHNITYIEVPARSTVTYEYMNVFNNYGNVSVASHGQLCLIGWPARSTHQIWHTSTIGSVGESFCYDPDLTCGYDFINDIRGVGFDPTNSGNQYLWGCNHGGGNFIWYGDYGRNVKDGEVFTVGYKNMKVFYKTYAPNMAEIIFSGVTQDDAVEFTFTAVIARTNDVSRATHTFEYKFVKDVTFERMAFYQFGGDRHSSGRWNGITIGNNDGPIEFELNGTTYGEHALIEKRDISGYIGGEMQRIEVPGEGLWIAYTDSHKQVNTDTLPGENANKTLSLLEYDAFLNGKHYSKPAFNVRTTEMFMENIIELCPSKEVGNTIKAGSTVKGAVEYLNLPPQRSALYCNSELLKSFPAEEFDTWKLAYRYAMGDKTTVTATKGSVVRNYPIAIAADGNEGTVAQITVKGGISFLPITFRGLDSHKGYKFQKQNGSAWETVDQSYFGNDFWQTYYDPETDSYEITYNVEHNGDPNASYTYRLVKEG